MEPVDVLPELRRAYVEAARGWSAPASREVVRVVASKEAGGMLASSPANLLFEYLRALHWRSTRTLALVNRAEDDFRCKGGDPDSDTSVVGVWVETAGEPAPSFEQAVLYDLRSCVEWAEIFSVSDLARFGLSPTNYLTCLNFWESVADGVLRLQTPPDEAFRQRPMEDWRFLLQLIPTSDAADDKRWRAATLSSKVKTPELWDLSVSGGMSVQARARSCSTTVDEATMGTVAKRADDVLDELLKLEDLMKERVPPFLEFWDKTRTILGRKMHAAFIDVAIVEDKLQFLPLIRSALAGLVQGPVTKKAAHDVVEFVMYFYHLGHPRLQVAMKTFFALLLDASNGQKADRINAAVTFLKGRFDEVFPVGDSSDVTRERVLRDLAGAYGDEDPLRGVFRNNLADVTGETHAHLRFFYRAVWAHYTSDVSARRKRIEELDDGTLALDPSTPSTEFGRDPERTETARRGRMFEAQDELNKCMVLARSRPPLTNPYSAALARIRQAQEARVVSTTGQMKAAGLSGVDITRAAQIRVSAEAVLASFGGELDPVTKRPKKQGKVPDYFPESAGALLRAVSNLDDSGFGAAEQDRNAAQRDADKWMRKIDELRPLVLQQEAARQWVRVEKAHSKTVGQSRMARKQDLAQIIRKAVQSFLLRSQFAELAEGSRARRPYVGLTPEMELVEVDFRSRTRHPRVGDPMSWPDLRREVAGLAGLPWWDATKMLRERAPQPDKARARKDLQRGVITSLGEFKVKHDDELAVDDALLPTVVHAQLRECADAAAKYPFDQKRALAACLLKLFSSSTPASAKKLVRPKLLGLPPPPPPPPPATPPPPAPAPGPALLRPSSGASLREVPLSPDGDDDATLLRVPVESNPQGTMVAFVHVDSPKYTRNNPDLLEGGQDKRAKFYNEIEDRWHQSTLNRGPDETSVRRALELRLEEEGGELPSDKTLRVDITSGLVLHFFGPQRLVSDQDRAPLLQAANKEEYITVFDRIIAREYHLADPVPDLDEVVVHPPPVQQEAPAPKKKKSAKVAPSTTTKKPKKGGGDGKVG